MGLTSAISAMKGMSVHLIGRSGSDLCHTAMKGMSVHLIGRSGSDLCHTAMKGMSVNLIGRSGSDLCHLCYEGDDLAEQLLLTCFVLVTHTCQLQFGQTIDEFACFKPADCVSHSLPRRCCCCTAIHSNINYMPCSLCLNVANLSCSGASRLVTLFTWNHPACCPLLPIIWPSKLIHPHHYPTVQLIHDAYAISTNHTFTFTFKYDMPYMFRDADLIPPGLNLLLMFLWFQCTLHP